MYNSRTYYGGAFLAEQELKDTNINHRIELEYYTTKNYINEETKEQATTYGIEIVKKEYKDDIINTESSDRKNISSNSEKVIEIIETLKKHKVTPIALNDVLEDLLKTS